MRKNGQSRIVSLGYCSPPICFPMTMTATMIMTWLHGLSDSPFYKLQQSTVNINAACTADREPYSNWAFTRRSDRRTDRSVIPRLRPTVCQTSRRDRLDRLWPNRPSVNQINVAC